MLLAGLAYSSALTVPYLWDDHLLLEGLGAGGSSIGERLGAAWGPFLGVYFRPLTLTTIALEAGAGRFASLVSHGLSLGIFLAACLAMTVFVLLALLSKEVGIAVAAAVVLRSQWPTFIGQGRPGGRALWMGLPTGLTLLFFTLRAQILLTLAPQELAAPDGADRALLVLGTLGTMFSQILWPYSPDLAIGSRAVPAAGDVSLAFGAIGLLALGGLVLGAQLRGARRLGLSAALCGLFLLPTSNLIPIEIASRTADRYLLLPWVALALMLGLALEAARQWRRDSRVPQLLTVGCVVVSLAGAAGTWVRVQDWQQEEHFLRSLHAEADSGNGQPALVLGSWLVQHGECGEVLPLLREAAGLLVLEGRGRSEAQARAGLADCLTRAGLPEEGLVEARAAVALDPELPGAVARIQRALRGAGRLHEAVEEGQRAIERYPRDADIASELSRSLAGLGQFAAAAEALVEARRRAGTTGPSALLERLRAAQADVESSPRGGANPSELEETR